LRARLRGLAEAGMDVAPDTRGGFAQSSLKGKSTDAQKEKANMLWTILVILLVLWLLGLVSGYTVGGFIHILLVVALVIFVINLLTGRRTV
jgi:Family of unknown function (DUF5670)